jgi:hypothetical protein
MSHYSRDHGLVNAAQGGGFWRPEEESMMNWQDDLETVGADIFRRYRKRLMSPDIVMQIRRDYPGLGLLDILVRVHAGRRILREGQDFAALAAIRGGQWQQAVGVEMRRSVRCTDWRRDPLSRALVMIGGGVFLSFCLLSLMSLSIAG